MRIGNVQTLAMSVNTSMNVNNSDMSTALSRLSSGLRINTSADDASSMTIANQLYSNANQVSQEIQNANDEIGMLQVADRAMSEQSQILETIKIKLVQKASDTQDTQSRLAIDKGIAKLLDSYDNIVSTISYNGKKLLSGTFESKNGLNIQSTAVSDIGHINVKEVETITLAGTTQFSFTKGNETITLKSVEIGHAEGTGIGELANVINARSSETGVSASFVVKSVSTKSIEKGDITDLKINDVTIGTFSVENNDTDNKLVTAINAKSSFTGVTGSVNSEGKLVLSSDDGRGIYLENAEGLEILASNYGKLSLTGSSISGTQVSADSVFRRLSFDSKTTTLDYINDKYVSASEGILDIAGSNTTVTSEMIANYSGNSGVINFADPMNVAAARQQYELDGSGYAVVVIDTGIDENHTFFKDIETGLSRVIYTEDFSAADADLNANDDGEGHGTHVASIIGSSDGTYGGVAPNVDLIGLKALNDDGSGAGTAAALQWVIDNAANYNISAVNMSLGGNTNSNTPETDYDSLLEEITNLGIINVAAAGNDYALDDPNQGASHPGNSIYTIGVGSTWANDIISDFSQRSTEVVDIFAHGSDIDAADTFNPLTGGVVNKSGTSMATPQVAGIVTLVQEYSERELGRKLTFDEMRDLIVNTAVSINDGDDEFGPSTSTGEDFWRIDALGAINALDSMKSSLVEPAVRGDYTYNHGANNVKDNSEIALSMSIVDIALSELSEVRASIGSTQNMLISDVNYKSVQNVNLMSSASQLQDADFAVESAQLQKSLILVQASSFAHSQIMQRYSMIEKLLA